MSVNYLKRVLAEWQEFNKAHRKFNEALKEVVNEVEEKPVIVLRVGVVKDDITLTTAKPSRLAELSAQTPATVLKVFGLNFLVCPEGLLSRQEPNENLYPFFYVGGVYVVNAHDDFKDITVEQILNVIEWIADLQKDI